MSPAAPAKAVPLNVKNLSQRNEVVLNVASDIMDDNVTLNIKIPGYKDRQVTVPKSKSARIRIFDNKHGGAKCSGSKQFCGGGGKSGGGGASGSWDRFTTDNALHHGGVYIYRDDGGAVAVLAQGAPLERPISAQLSSDGNTLWVMDQHNASMFSVPFPSADMFEQLFPRDLKRHR